MIEFGSGPLAGIDLTDPRVHAERDLRDVWRQVRSTQPLTWHPTRRGGFWAVSRYHDVRGVYADTRHFTSKNGNSLDSLMAGGDPAGGMMLSLSDGPRHLALRSAILKRLPPPLMKRVGDGIERDVRSRLADVLDVTCDFAADFARHIPLDAICGLLGVDDHDQRAALHSLASTALSAAERDTTAEQCAIARIEILQMFAEIVESRRHRLGDDLISDLIRMESSSVGITSDEILYNCYSLLLGGNEEPRFAITGMFKALAENHGEWQRLKSGQVSVRSAVEEILRWTTPVLHLARTVVEDVVVGGTTLRAGQIVSLWNTSANFDEAVFADADTLRLDRAPNEHLSFGFGSHFCLGANLARMELSAVAAALVSSVDTIELTGAARPVYSNFISGLAALPGRLTSARTTRVAAPGVVA